MIQFVQEAALPKLSQSSLYAKYDLYKMLDIISEMNIIKLHNVQNIIFANRK